MSGHNKWSSIKHKKAAVDSKRGKLFSKLIKEMTIAAREKGGILDANPRLRAVVDKAKAANMPNDTIDRAIKRGTGEIEGVQYEELTYEAYGPGGTAILIEVVTDNRNRTTPEMRKLLSKHNGNLGESNSVAWMFDRKGLFVFNREGVNGDALMEAAIDLGASDVEETDTGYDITCDPTDFNKIKKGLEDKGFKFESAEVEMVPKNTVPLQGNDARVMLNLLEVIEDHDDVQNVYANCEIVGEVPE